MYKLRANQRDLGSHVANASFMVDPAAPRHWYRQSARASLPSRGAKRRLQSLQFNFVVSTNIGAVSLWKKLGFSIVGTVPKAFKHHQLGYVDAYVMHRFLNDG
jgi:hypothetical protein